MLQFPHIHPTIGVFMTIVIEAEDPAGDHEFKVELTEQDRRAVDVVTEGSFSLPERPEGADREEGIMQLVAHKVGLTVPHEGRYWVTLSIGGVELDQIPLHVAAAPSEPEPENSQPAVD